MKYIKATFNDINNIIDFYNDVIDNTPTMDKYCKWKHGLHPTSDTIKNYIINDELYYVIDDNEIISCFVLTNSETIDYRNINWVSNIDFNFVSELHMFAINPKYQGKGLSKIMVKDIINIAKDNNKKAIRLDALEINIPAQNLYTSMGFNYITKKNIYTPNTGNIDFYFYELKLL